jgi:hypothetical protein
VHRGGRLTAGSSALAQHRPDRLDGAQVGTHRAGKVAGAHRLVLEVEVTATDLGAGTAGITVFRVAFERWVDPANRKSLQRLARESLRELRAVTKT